MTIKNFIQIIYNLDVYKKNEGKKIRIIFPNNLLKNEKKKQRIPPSQLNQ